MLACSANAAGKPVAPPVNPFMADSTNYETHTRGHHVDLAGPEDMTRQLDDDEIIWQPLGPNNTFAPVYSSPYPNGKRVIWTGGYDRIAKLDADTLEVLTTYSITRNLFFTETRTRRHIEIMDSTDHLGALADRWTYLDDTYDSLFAFYKMVSARNEFYVPLHKPDGSIALQVYGERDATDPASTIELRREWTIPRGKGVLFGLSMTFDGWVTFATSDGTVYVLSEDFQTHHSIQLPQKPGSKAKNARDTDIFDAFLRNITINDDKGFIYVVTRDYMHRISWNGERLSLDEKQGAWTVTYPDEQGVGSGTTPALMGWGPEEDHLVLIADGTYGNNVIAFWRDEIPADWEGLAGYDRRVAGVTPVVFGVSEDEKPQVENSIVVYGNGAFIDLFANRLEGVPDQGGFNRNVLAGSFLSGEPGFEARGGTMIKWDKENRKLETAWSSQLNFAMSICSASAVNELLYCWGARDGKWTMEAVEWHTGKSAFHYVLGESHKYNAFGAPVQIAPNGAIDCSCVGGLGLVRVQPKQNRQTKQ